MQGNHFKNWERLKKWEMFYVDSDFGVIPPIVDLDEGRIELS
jgi:hypothetical protein